MNQMRHNFIRFNRFESQLLNILSESLADICGADNLFCEIHHMIEKPWQSATYEGNEYQYMVAINGADESLNFVNDHHIGGLNKHLSDHQFSLIKSFVAEIKITKIKANPTNHQDKIIIIETLIIDEE